MSEHPSWFYAANAKYCENCSAYTDAETQCPACTSSRLVPLEPVRQTQGQPVEACAAE